MNDLARLEAKLDMVLSLVTALQEAHRASLKPMTRVAFAKKVGLSRWTVAKRIASGQIATKGGLIPPTELKKFGV